MKENTYNIYITIFLMRNHKILFDGHHSLLSYMIAGRMYLHEVLHFINEDENGHVDIKEIFVFFGVHSKKLNDSNWRKYVINWQAPKERQLCKREQNNMSELLVLISVFFNKNKNNSKVDV